MSKPSILRQTLKTPEGINNYSGAIFRCFTKGDTLPFKFTFRGADGKLLETSGWKVTIILSSGIFCDADGCNDSSVSVEVDIPPSSFEQGVFEGAVSDIKTQSLPCGIIYALAQYTTGVSGTDKNPIDGETHIIDMCRLEVYPNIITIKH